MSSRRNTGHELNEAELRALLQLRLQRVPDSELNELLPRYTPSEIIQRLGRDDRSSIIQARIESALRELHRLSVHVITSAHPRYPKRLEYLEADRPPVLFCRGDLELLNANSVAVIGRRRSTEYGNAAAEMIAHDLARCGITIVSGLALGIDTSAHRGALAAAGKTIAVLGCGIDVYYPHRNADLQERIAADGLLISEFVPGAPAMQHHFLQRNRIIAVLPAGVVVVEAGSRSGTQNTVTWALCYGVDVFAVPGPIGREASFGTNALIRDGAAIVTSVDDILRELPWQVTADPLTTDSTIVPAPGDPVAARIFAVLGPVALQVDQIARSAGCPSATALAALAELELDGYVRQLPGKRFARAEIRTGR